MQQVHRFTVAVTANNDVTNIVDHTTELKTGWLTRVVLVLEKLTVWHKIASISYHEHVTDVSVTVCKERQSTE